VSSQPVWIKVLWVESIRPLRATTLTQKKRKQKAWTFCTALATWMDNTTGRASVSFAVLSEDTGFSEDFLQAGLKAAKELGLVHVKAQWKSGSKERDVSVYHARFPKGMKPEGYQRSGDGWAIDQYWEQRRQPVSQPASDPDSNGASGAPVEAQPRPQPLKTRPAWMDEKAPKREPAWLKEESS
jgi:hypothetical protein